MSAVTPIQNQFQVMPIEKVHGGFVFFSLIFAIGSLLGALGVYGYDSLTFTACMYSITGISIFVTALLLHRRHTYNIARLIEQTWRKIEAYPNENVTQQGFQDFSYLFSLFLEQLKMGDIHVWNDNWFRVEFPSIKTLNCFKAHVAQASAQRNHLSARTNSITIIYHNEMGTYQQRDDYSIYCYNTRKTYQFLIEIKNSFPPAEE